MTTNSNKLVPELSNPYVPGRCWRMMADMKMCQHAGALYSVTRNGTIFARMWLCDKCAAYMRDRAKYTVTKVTEPKGQGPK